MDVNPKLEFVNDGKKETMAPKIQGVRVIVDTSKINSKIEGEFHGFRLFELWLHH